MLCDGAWPLLPLLLAPPAGEARSARSGSIASNGSAAASALLGRPAAAGLTMRAGSMWNGRLKEKVVGAGGEAASASTSAGVAGKANRPPPPLPGKRAKPPTDAGADDGVDVGADDGVDAGADQGTAATNGEAAAVGLGSAGGGKRRGLMAFGRVDEDAFECPAVK